MSVAERRRRKDSRGKTGRQLHAWRCRLCMAKISQADYRARRNVAVTGPGNGLAFRLAHLACQP